MYRNKQVSILAFLFQPSTSSPLIFCRFNFWAMALKRHELVSTTWTLIFTNHLMEVIVEESCWQIPEPRSANAESIRDRLRGLFRGACYQLIAAIRPLKGVITPFVTSRGPPCTYYP